MTSWIILNTRTGQPLCETFSPETVEEVRSLHKGTLEAIPKEIWIARLNERKLEQEAKGALDRFITEYDRRQGDRQ